MVVAFGLLVGLCLEWIGAECKHVVCWNVVEVVAYGLKGIARLVVVNMNVKIKVLGMDWSVVGCKCFREVKEIIN